MPVARDPLDASATPERLLALRQASTLSGAAFDRAVALANASPPPSEWVRFLNRAFLGLGSGLVLSGVIYFFAYNWAKLAKFGKFALIEAAMAGAWIAVWRLGLQRLPGRLALTFGCGLVGVLLAVYGQTYQTGADPFQLFLAWAVLILPLVVVGRFPPLILLELVVLNVAAILYWEQVVEPANDTELLLLPALFVLNGAAWLGWEILSQRDWAWASGRWLPRLLAAACFGSLTFPVLLLIVDNHHDHGAGVLSLVLLTGTLAGAGWFYFTRRHDLFMVAAGLGSVMTVVSTGIGRVIFDGHADIGEFFLMGLIIVGEVAGAAWWLRQLNRAWGEA